MPATAIRTIAFPALVLCLLPSPSFAATAPDGGAAPTTRTVYVSITTNKGEPVDDLTPADLVVKEGGKEREIVKVEPASARLRLTVAVEEALVRDGAVRMGLFSFMKQMISAADIRFVTIALQNTVVVDYTSDMNTLVSALNNLTLNPSRDSNVAEGILEIADDFVRKPADRPAMVLLALSGGQAGVEPRTVFDKLRQSGAVMYAVTLAAGAATGPVGSLVDQSAREQVLGDGPKQSGGRRFDLNTTEGFQKSLQQVASDLLAQYAVTYTLPDGVKPDKRFGISSKRKGLTLRAPSQIPDR